MRTTRLLAAALAFLAATSCVGVRTDRGTPQREGPQRTVELIVVSGRGGSTLALVPVFISDEGPLPFALDTGASESVIDRRLVRELDLRVIEGTEQVARGIAGQASSELVAVEQWRIGDVELERSRIRTLDLGGGGEQAPLAGLLGSDILSRFGAVTVDYENGKLIIRNAAAR